MSRRRIERNENLGNDIKLVATLFVSACTCGCATGSAIVLGQERSPIDPAIVTLYAEPPPHYEVVGTVKAASGVWLGFDKTAEERAFAELEDQAATIGANGVIEWEVGERVEPHYDAHPNFPSTTPQRTKAITVTGTAILVTSINRSE